MSRPRHPDSYYEEIKRKFAEERDLRLAYRPEGTQQFTSEFAGDLARYATDPYGGDIKPRALHTGPVDGGLHALVAAERAIGRLSA